MAKEFKTLSEKVLRIMDAPEGYGILFCNVLDIKEFIKIIENIMRNKMTRGEMVERLRKAAGDKLTK